MKPTFRSNGILLTISTALACAVLSACGGGGSNLPEDTNLLPGQDATTITSVPAPDYANPISAAAMDRLNVLRRAAGLGALAQNSALDNASALQARYLESNGGGTQVLQVEGNPAFSAVTAQQRMALSNYPVDTTSASAQIIQLSGIDPVDALMASPYSRALLLQYRMTSIGLSESLFLADETQNTLVFSIAKTETGGQSSSVELAAWPVNGATSVPTTMYRRGTDPIPETGGADVGYPVSVHAYDLEELETTTFTLRNAAGVLIDTKLITSTDVILSELGLRNVATLIPTTPLAAGTYTAKFNGKLLSKASYAPRYGDRELSWTFTVGTTATQAFR